MRTKQLPARYSDIARKFLASLLSMLLTLQPVLARAQNVAADGAAAAINRPGVGAAPNGVSMIDIVTPNTKGLSHNKYNSFNVGAQGLILNNFNGEVGTSKLGGVTPGNPNLQGRSPASVILNEVTSTNRSSLLGPTEVFGGKADVIIANPNGITCDGCGFINTPRATLTTGAPDIGADGQLNGFTVRGGDVTFGSKGANVASGDGAVDLFDIVSRTIKVDGPIHGKDLRLTAGASKFNYATGEHAELEAVSGTPDYAIDGSALGAMQANRIKMVVTEKGAGVRMRADMAANAGELSLSADGKISIGDASGAQGVAIKSGKSVETKKLSSKTHVDVQADSGVTLETVAADGAIDLAGGNGLLSVAGDVSTLGAIRISSTGIAAGTLDAGDLIDLASSSGSVTIGDTRSQGPLTIEAIRGSIIATSLLSYDNISLTAGSSLSMAGNVTAAGAIDARASTITANAILSGVDLAATARSASDVVLSSAGDLKLVATDGSITATDVMSAGDVTAVANQDLSYQSLQSKAAAALSVTRGTISLDKTTRAAGDISVSATSIDLSNGRSGIATSGTLSIYANSADFSGSTLTFGGLSANLTGTADLTDARVNTVAKAGGTGDLSIAASAVTLSGSSALLAEHDLNLTLGNLSNAGQIAANNDLNVSVSSDLTNSQTGLIYAGGNANLFVAGNLTNDQGAIITGDNLLIAGASPTQRNHALTNISGMIRSGGDLSILTDNLSNQRLTAPSWATRSVGSTVVSGFRLNPAVAGKPFAHLFNGSNDDDWWLYQELGLPKQYLANYSNQLWSVASTADGTSWRANTWISSAGPTWSDNIRDWLIDNAPRNSSGDLVLNPNNPSRFYLVHEQGSRDTSTIYRWDSGANISQSTTEDYFTAPLTPEALILAGADLTLDATTATNAFSTIEAVGDATLKGDTLTNEGMALNRTTRITCNAQSSCQGYDSAGNPISSKSIAKGTSIVSKLESVGSAAAIIRAGGDLDASGVETVNNSVAAGTIAGSMSVAQPTDSADPTAVLGSMTASSALFSVAGATGAALKAALAQVPVNPQSGGIGGSMPGQSFLYETRAAYLDVGAFYGSSYFLGRIGFQPDRQVPFLGDAYFENQYIDQQLRLLSGQGLGTHSFVPGSDAVEQVKLLLDQGVEFAKNQNLVMGQVLSPEQVAALTKPLVWYETKVVSGIEVLVPVVYVPSTEMAQITASGALMAGDNVTINGDQISNSGTMLARNDLSVSGSSISADGGSFQAGGNVSLASAGALTLGAQARDIEGQTVVIGASVEAGGNASLSAGSDLTLRGASVSARGNTTLTGQNVTLDIAKAENGGQENATGSSVSGRNLAISANDNINVIGSTATADQALSLNADNGSVNIASAGLNRQTSDSYTTTTSTEQQRSQLSAGTDATIKAGDDLLLAGSALKAGGSTTLEAGGDVNIIATQERKDETFGKNTAAAITHTLSEIQAGGSVSIAAGSNLNIIGGDVSADGKVALKAAEDITIAEVRDSAFRDMSWKTGRAKDHVRIETETSVGSSISGSDGVSTVSGGDTMVSASGIEAGSDGHSADLSMSTGGDLVIASGKDSTDIAQESSKKGFLSKRNSQSHSFDETTIASDLSASGNIKLNADGNAVVAGSQVTAGGSLSLEGDSVSVIGAQEQHQFESSSKKSGLFAGSGAGFISLWGKEQSNKNQASELNAGSSLTAGTDVTLEARLTDVNVMGSEVKAGRDIALEAARDVNITPGAEASSAFEQEKRSGFGISYSFGNGGASVGIGVGKSEDRTERSSDTNAVSALSAGRDLSINADRDINLQATQASAERDLTLDAVRDVNLLAAMDQSNYASMHKELFAGISLNVSGGIVGAGMDLAEAASKLDGENGKYAIAPAALAAYKAAKLAGSGASLTPSASLTVGFSASKQTQSGSATAPVVTTLRSGGSTAIVAETGDITGNGAQIAAGYDAAGKPLADGNILLSAGDEINLSSAIGGSSGSFDSKSMGASIGIDLGTGGLVANGSYAKGQGGNDASYNLNSHVAGTGTVVLNSGADANLKGAVVSGETVIANVGGDLNIESRQDTATYREKSFGAQAGLGASGLSGGVNLGKIEGDFANVSEQSGIIAGEGGYHVAAGGNVDLKGGVIASSAEKEKNALSAESLTWSNLENHSSASTSNLGLSASLPGSGSAPSTAPLGGLAISPSVGVPAKEGSSGSALATLTPGNLNLANQSQDLAALNTDLSKANTQAEIFDIDRLKARQESAAALSELLNGLTGDISAKLGFAEGSPEKTALHAAVGAIVAKMAGGDVGSGALAGAVSEIANGLVQDLLKTNPDLTDAQKASLTQWAAVAVGAAVGGQLGAATALDNVNHNYLTHEQLDKFAAELKGCASEPDSVACEQRVSQRYEELDFAQERAFEACRTMACAEEHLSQMQFDQKRLYAQILAIQELGADSALGQRLLANQVNERPLTGDGSVLDQRITDVLAGISYCEANGGSAGCFETGQRVKFFSEAVTLAAYTALGISNLNRGNGSVKPGQGDAVDGGVPSAPNKIPVPDDLPTNINVGQQGKHIKGHNNYQDGRSYFNDGVDPAELLAGVHSGRYPVVGTGARGYPVVDFGRPIGVDGRTGQSVTRGQIHYGKNGAHIVPDARN
jgi:filamentous hemagglutinin